MSTRRDVVKSRRGDLDNGTFLNPIVSGDHPDPTILEHAYDLWRYPDDWIVEMYSGEGPKLLRRGKYFYLIAAVGGTSGPPTGHMVVVSRSCGSAPRRNPRIWNDSSSKRPVPSVDSGLQRRRT